MLSHHHHNPPSQVAYLRHEEPHVSIVRCPFLPFIKNTIPEPDDLTAFSKGRSLYQYDDDDDRRMNNDGWMDGLMGG